MKHEGPGAGSTEASYETIPDPDSNANLPVVTITNFSGGSTSKEVILIGAGEHARELITSEITYWFGVLLSLGFTGQGDELADWAALQPVQAAAWKTGSTKTTLAEWAESLLQRVVFKLLPVVNLSGRKAAEAGDTCQRKTVSGVDLNRNWPFEWKQVAQGDDEYGGEKPFSEPESRIVKLVADGAQLRSYVNLHAGEWALYTPWDSQKNAPPGLPEDIDELLEKLNMHCECMSGPAGSVAGYLAFGTAMDYMFHDMHVPYALTFEVFGPDGLGKLARGGHPRRLHAQGGADTQLPLERNGAGGHHAGPVLTDATAVQPLVREVQEGAGGREEGVETREQRCLRSYNPLAQEDYQDVVARWLGALLVLAAHLAAHPAASDAAHDAGQSQLPLPPVKPSKQDLVRMGKTAVEEHQHPEIFVRDARSVADQLAERNASLLPETSANKSLPVQQAEFIQEPRRLHGAARRSALAMFFGGWSLKSFLVAAAIVVAVVALLYHAGGISLRPRSMRLARRRSAGRRPQRYQV